MTDAIIVAIIVAIPSTITAVGSVLAARTAARIARESRDALVSIAKQKEKDPPR